MKKFTEIALGIITSVGGFLEVGSIATAIQAGAGFGYQLSWASLAGGLCLIFLVEMSGRMAAISKRTIVDAIRERFGFGFFFFVLAVTGLVAFLLLASEIGGVCIALEFVTHIHFQWWAPLVGFAAWLVLWRGSFKAIENGVSILGLITFVFVVAAWRLHPHWADVARCLIPHMPHKEQAHYWFMAVSILGASTSPYLFYFYSAGAVEDGWNESHLATNRFVSAFGMSFGALIAIAPLILAAILLQPSGIRVEHYSQLPSILSRPYGFTGVALFSSALAIACFGAILEIALSISYTAAQGLGWNWGEDLEPHQATRFAAAYTVILIAATLLAMSGIDPLKLTNVTMALTAVSLPVAVIPFLIIMNDSFYVKSHTNGWISNTVVLAITLMALVLSIVSIPLEIFGGS